jgi:hypothetical protein
MKRSILPEAVGLIQKAEDKARLDRFADEVKKIILPTFT